MPGTTAAPPSFTGTWPAGRPLTFLGTGSGWREANAAPDDRGGAVLTCARGEPWCLVNLAGHQDLGVVTPAGG